MLIGSCRPRFYDVGTAILVAAPLAALWLWILARTDGSDAYAVPLALFLLAAAGWVFWCGALGRRWAVEVLFCLTIFVPNVTLRPPDATRDTNLDLQSALKVVIWGVLLGVGFLNLRRILPLLRTPAVMLILVYTAIAFASTLYSEMPVYTLACSFGLLAYLLFAMLLTEVSTERRVLELLTGMLFLYILVNIAAAFVMPDVAIMAPSVEETEARLSGVSGHPNVLGQQLALFLGLVSIGWLRGYFGGRRALLYAAVAVGALVATGSRTSLVALFAGVAAVLLRRTPRLARALGTGLAAAAALILAGFALGIIPDIDRIAAGLSRTGNPEEIMTLTGRTELWSFVWHKVTQSPLLGYGFNATDGILQREFVSPSYGSSVNAHNMVLQLLFSLGFMGLAPIVGLFGLLFRRMATAPDDFRDLVAVLIVVDGLSEVEVFGALPVLELLILYLTISFDGWRQLARRSVPAPRRPRRPAPVPLAAPGPVPSEGD